MTPADVEFLRKHTSGFICVGMEGGRLDELALPLMVASAANEEAMYTAFTVGSSEITALGYKSTMVHPQTDWSLPDGCRHHGKRCPCSMLPGPCGLRLLAC